MAMHLYVQRATQVKGQKAEKVRHKVEAEANVIMFNALASRFGGLDGVGEPGGRHVVRTSPAS